MTFLVLLITNCVPHYYIPTPYFVNLNFLLKGKLLQTAGCIISLYIISPKMTGIMVAVVPLIVMTGTFIGKILRTMSKQAQSQVCKVLCKPYWLKSFF